MRSGWAGQRCGGACFTRLLPGRSPCAPGLSSVARPHAAHEPAVHRLRVVQTAVSADSRFRGSLLKLPTPLVDRRVPGSRRCPIPVGAAVRLPAGLPGRRRRASAAWYLRDVRGTRWPCRSGGSWITVRVPGASRSRVLAPTMHPRCWRQPALAWDGPCYPRDMIQAGEPYENPLITAT